MLLLLALVALNATKVNALDLKDFTVAEGRNPKSLPQQISSADGECYYQLKEDGSAVVKYSYKTGQPVATVFNAQTLKSAPSQSWDGFELSKDESKLLIYKDKTPIYRHSFEADYYVYDIKRNNLKHVSDKGLIQGAVFSPDGLMVAYVYDNNIYLRKLDYDSEVAVTKDGEKNAIINGIPDWVYQEEFGVLSSLTFSADSQLLCFGQWNESEVGEYSIPLYKGAVKPNKDYALYPGSFTYKYPKAGTKNSKVTVFSYNVDNRTLLPMQLPSDAYYVPYITFGAGDKLMVMTLNRDQNQLKLYSANPRSAVSTLIYHDEAKSWIEINDIIPNVRFYDTQFVIPSERSGHCHLYAYSNAGALIKQITTGDYDVTAFYGYDEKSKTYYFQSTVDGAVNRTICSVDTKSVLSKLSPKTGYDDAVFSRNFSYYVIDHSELNVPNQYTLYCGGKKVRDLEMNQSYASSYGSAPKKELFTFTDNGLTYNGYMIKPLDFNPAKKYPVILSQYSGPNSQKVLNKWTLDWEQYAAQSGYIVVCVDGRGTGGRGVEWKSKIYLNLGKYEAIDQIATARFMATQPYVDASRIGIYGWSYGGFETLMAMSQSASPFACGVAIAPVTDWRYYDTVYTERYMHTPQANSTGYNASSAIALAGSLRGRLLLMAGTADDNVHFSNTLEYASALSAQDKMFDMMVYPNMNHSINTGNVRMTLYRRVLDHFDSYLKK